MKVRTCGDLQVWWIPQFPMKAFEVDALTTLYGDLKQRFGFLRKT